MQQSQPQKHQSSNESEDFEEEEEEEESFNIDSDDSFENSNSSSLDKFRIEPIIPTTRRNSSVSLTSDEPRSGILRVWTEEDEIIVLKGMLHFVKKGKSPYTDAVGFLGCFGEALSFEASVEQVKFKMRRLKTRFDVMARRAVGDKDPAFEKPHDLRLYRLAKKIWGRKDGKFAEIVGIGFRRKEKKEIRVSGDECENSGHQKKQLKFKVFPCLDDLMKMDVLDCSKEQERIAGLIKKKQKLEVSDVKAHLKWIDLVKEKALKVLEVIESTDSIELFKRSVMAVLEKGDTLKGILLKQLKASPYI